MPVNHDGTDRTTKSLPDSFVFIVTYGRSGSTLLQSLLNGINGYCIRGENGGVLSHLSRAYHTLQDATPISGLRTSSSPSPTDHPWFGGECIDLRKFGTSLCANFIENVLSLPEGTRVGGFKEIRYHSLGDYLDRHLDFISQFFPNSKFIFNKRNLQDVSRSGWWRDQSQSEVIRILSKANERFDNYASCTGNSSIVMEYDQYKDDPETLETLYRFLGEPFDKDSVDNTLKKKLTHLQHI